MKMYLLLLLFFINVAQGEVLKKNDQGDFVLSNNKFSTRELLANYGKLMGYNISITKDLKDYSFEAQGTLTIPKNQMESYLASILSHGGYAMVRMPDSKYVQVIDMRDLRFTTVPIYTKREDIPANDNPAQLNFSLKYIDSRELARNMRPFMGRYGRIIDIKSSNTIYVIDSGKNLRRMAEIASYLDTEEYRDNKKEMDQINEKHKLARKKGKNIFEIISNNQIIFILIFFLMGIIIGFGTRGFVMKRIEGGW